MWCQNGRSSVIGLQYFCGPIREVLTFGGEAWDSLLFTFLQMGNPLSFSSILCKNQLSWFLIKWFSAYAFHKTKDHLQGIVTLCYYANVHHLKQRWAPNFVFFSQRDNRIPKLNASVVHNTSMGKLWGQQGWMFRSLKLSSQDHG